MATPARTSSLISRVVALVALALFAIEIGTLVPFTYLYWERLLELRREALERQALAARPHVREALLREKHNESFKTDEPPEFEDGLECFIYTASGEYRLTVSHELAPVKNAPPRSVALAAFEPDAKPVFFEQGGVLVYVAPLHLEPRAAGRSDAVLYVSAPLSEMKKQFASYGILSFLVGGATLLLMGTITVYHLRQRFLLPLARIIAADNAARRGERERILIRDENIPQDELGAIMRSRNALIGRMTSAQRALDEKNAELEKQREELAAWGRELERLVQEKTQELVQARESLYVTEKLAALGRLAAMVAHEINNPLASIAGYAEEVRERLAEIEGTPGDLPEGLRVIEDQAFRCKEILKRLLGLARSDKFKVEPVDLGALARDTVHLCEPSARRKGIVLEVRARDGLVARSDLSSIQQVILNLVENALDAAGAARESRGKGGHVVVSVAARSEGGLEGGREFVIRVADDGFGVAEAIRDRVFDPYYTTKPVGRGTGLGLAICQSIVERLGGRIEIESVEGQGATFIVVLPHDLPPGAEKATPTGGIWRAGEDTPLPVREEEISSAPTVIPARRESEGEAAFAAAARAAEEAAASADPDAPSALAATASDADPDARAAPSDELI
ncbi:HAMP domain-containing histidine kinase [bacterium]|nr:HAMP domain-containing histidine kinase [bacterium]